MFGNKPEGQGFMAMAEQENKTRDERLATLRAEYAAKRDEANDLDAIASHNPDGPADVVSATPPNEAASSAQKLRAEMASIQEEISSLEAAE